jgi:hypothetical protein
MVSYSEKLAGVVTNYVCSDLKGDKSVARLAFYTFGLLHEPWGGEVVRPFVEAAPDVFSAAAAAPGYIARAVPPDLNRPKSGQDYGEWGVHVTPRFNDGGSLPGTVTVADTLSLWANISAVRAFAYSGKHVAALKRRWEWFRKGDWPPYVMWWVGDCETPTWGQATSKLELLHDKGPTVAAFNFRTPFGADGRPTSIMDGQP